MNPSSIPWVFGFSAELRTDDQYRDIANIILQKYHSIPRRPKTSAAELGLGIRESWYAYIGKAHPVYGNGIFFLEVHLDNWDSSDYGICPFDTGGLWWDYIKTNPTFLSTKDKVAFFKKNDKPLANWDIEFRTYINTNYSLYEKYVLGAPPDIGPGIPHIIESVPPNSDLAWTWEGRIEKSKMQPQTRTTAFYCTDEKKTHLTRHIYDLPLISLREKQQMLRWLKNAGTSCPISTAPVEIANHSILVKGV